MAGAVAMASVIEDFETQPRKRQRKDAPPVKTITNYYSPVPKPFSPPKSNILDYFGKTSPTGVKSSAGTAEQTKENRNREPEPPGCGESPAKPRKPQRLRRGRRPGRPSRLSASAGDGLAETPPQVIEVSESSCSSDGAVAEAAAAGKQAAGVLGSETAALLAQISRDDCVVDETPSGAEPAPISTLPKKSARESLTEGSPDDEQHLEEGPSPSVQLLDQASPGDKRKRGRPVAKPVRKTKCSLQKCSPEAQEADGSPCDTSLEGKADEPSQLNNSTVVISFEDFVQSQTQEDSSACVETPENKAEVLAAPPSAEGQPGPSQQVSPRTLTVQAEVHPVSPATELARAADQRLASIFTRRRRGSEGGEGKATGSPPPQEKPEPPLGPVRRSNVVLREDELELSVIESSSAPKCSQAERKQFMNAFKQASLDSGKGKAKKGPGKQGEAGDDAQPEEAERQEEDAQEEQGQASTPALKVEQEKPARAGQKRGGKLRKSGRKRAQEEAVVPVPAAALEEPVLLEVGSEADGDGAKDTPFSTPAGGGPVRRSARTRPCSVTPAREEATPPPKTRSRDRSKGRGGTEDCSAEASTPRTRKPKHGMYRAEMISPPDAKGSPIRMRLRRVFPNFEHHESGDADDLQILSPLAVQKSSVSKNRKQAKKLVQKARVLQQNKKAAAAANADSKAPVRRLSRNRDVQKSSCEDEDSSVCLPDGQSSPAPAAEDKASGQKRLRSLNDVLGRTAAENRAVKSSAAPKVAAVFLGKKPPKPSAVISILDDSSREGSENSQDDEEFRARRDFLMSGLPESFKRQVARTTASRDAYSLACASFQATVHVLQRPPECPFWGLPWPGSPLLKRLNGAGLEPPRPLLPPGALDCIKTEPALRAHMDKGSGWRQDFSEDVRRRLLEEIRASNPPFPVRRFFAWFLRRREEHLLQPASAEADGDPETPSLPEAPELGGKRKRRRDGEGEGEGVQKVPKRRRSARGEREAIVIADDPPAATGPPDPPARAPAGRGRLSRARGGGQPRQEAEADAAERTPAHKGPVILLEDTPPPGQAERECVREDVLWTEKYQPQHSNEVVGNSAAVKRLRSWLEEWKQRADREERRNRKEKKQEDNSNDSWDCGDFRGEGDVEDGEELLGNTLLITGPPGVGKTAAVYACAQELGFKVFEVNASSQRSGRQILSQLKEATQSHQVDIQGVNAHKPSYFSSYSTARPAFSPRKVNSPRKVLPSPRKVVSSPRKIVSYPRKPLHPTGRQPKRGALAPTSLASFFKMAGKAKGRDPSARDDPPQNESVPQKPVKTKESVPKAKPSCDKKEPPTEEQNKKAATSLILFEEVDVIFDDDSGFLAAIKTFMTTTKRPVILTTSDPTFSEMFDGNFEEIHFKTPSAANVTSYLRLLCLAEGVRTDARDLSSLLRWNRGDIRQSLLHLQFWVRSGGGPGPHRPLPALEPAAVTQGETGSAGAAKLADEEPAASSTSCDSRCTESLLGILNIDGPQDLSDMLKCSSSAEPQSSRCLELLVESWGRGVDLLYSNMEALLPLPVCALQRPLLGQQGALKAEPRSAAPAEEEEASPVKASSRMRGRKRSGLTDRDLFQSDSDSDDGFLSLPKLHGAPASEAEEPSAGADAPRPDPAAEAPPPGPGPLRPKKADLSPEEQRRSELVSSCLGSLAEFMDHMSFLDSSLHHQRWQPEGACRPGAFGWTGAAVKNGLSDEPRVEDASGACWGSSAQIRAAVESMSFRRCRSRVSEAWAEPQGLQAELGEPGVGQLTLPVGPHRTGLSFCQTSPCEPTVTQRRCDVMKTVLTSRAFGTLGNKPATATDYLPFLRSVCRSERAKEQGKVKRRFLHYLDSIHLGLSKNTVQLLAADFP
ncbi:ATPase family AAA domain-containing protein 5b [Anguilla anguilla]|uniref:ATPase family AAA domain-containing protein 5b n=1 Tax=Anguilla anguilla TaxID=7936 RepID=UPI0015B27775|nr:ATPase family AAA domain-containing protein 5b [Anguilla anguilla]